jgi:tetratricopeptide (TPR) repeat protein
MTEAAPPSWKERFAAARGPALWAANTRILMRDARTYRGEQLQRRLKHFAFWAEYSAKEPDSADTELLAEFVEDFSRLAGNYGSLGEADISTALDNAIALRQRNGDSTTRLHLAKARYLATLSLEGAERELALRAAVDSVAAGTELWAEAFLAYAWYYIDVSQYDQALQMLRALEAALPRSLFDQKYRCGALTLSGVALFTSFQDLRAAEQYLHDACNYDQAGAADTEIRHWVATAYHYLGRIAEVGQKYATALSLYLQGQAIQDECPEDLQALAFLHVRIAEPLIAVGLFEAARDHLNLALELFQLSGNHSSGRLQAELGFATLSAAQGQLDEALDTVEASRVQARDMGFWRGELLCLGYLMALSVRGRRFQRVPRLLIDILRTTRGGELGRNNTLRLLTKVPVVLGVAIRRMSHRVRAGKAEQEPIAACFCQLHSPTNTL